MDHPTCNTAIQGGATTSKKVPRRKENYSKQQDLVLCSAYLNVSRDPIVGTNQSADTYWSRIHQYFHDHHNGGSRTKESLQHRWSAIQKDTARFCGFKAEQDRLNCSGKTEDDRITDALRAYHAEVGKVFQFMHCWEVLRNEKKWHSWLQGTVECSRRVRREPGPFVEEAAQDDVPARPIGRDSAKKRRSEIGSSSTNSARLEVLQRFSMSKERENEAAMSKERENETATAATDSIMAVEQEKVAMKKEMLLVKQEQVKLEKQRLEDERRQRAEEAEMRIMLLDISQFDPLRRAYFLRRQQAILNREMQRDPEGGPSSHM